jgi:hypothetical protein
LITNLTTKNEFKIDWSKNIDDINKKLQKVPQFSLNELRRELFQLFYKENTFVLYDKSDPRDVFAIILHLLHKAEFLHSHSNLGDNLDADLKCDGCIAHSTFYINPLVIKRCECKNVYPNVEVSH